MTNEIILSGLIGSISALVGALIGSIIAPWRNHKYSLEKLREEHKKKLDYMKSEIFFRKKVEFFERIIKEIETMLNAYSELKVLYLIRGDKSGEKVKEIFEEIRNLEEIYPRGISLYFENKNINLELAEFIAKGTNIYLKLPELRDQLIKNSLNETFIKNLNQDLDEILKLGERLIFTLKKDLEKL